MCPCHSNQPYAACCEPFHRKQSLPDPVQLMRSRYAAYALGLSDYIMRTTHPSHPDKKQNKFVWKRQIEKFSRDTDFVGLTIEDHHIDGDTATVTFIAHLRHNDEPNDLREKSDFALVDNNWLYLGATD